jgi:hypothetical protein
MRGRTGTAQLLLPHGGGRTEGRKDGRTEWRWPLYLLAVFLFAWEPLRVAGELTQSLSTMGMRGAPAIVELAVHLSVAAIAVAAAWSLWEGAIHGTSLAMIALALSAGVSVQSLYWSRLPHQTPPGAELPFATLAVAHASFWIAYLLAVNRGREAPAHRRPVERPVIGGRRATRFFQ